MPRWPRMVVQGIGPLSVLSCTLTGCATWSPLPQGAYIQTPIAVPRAPEPKLQDSLPEAPVTPEGKNPFAPRLGDSTPLNLSEVLQSVEASFPLLYAIEQERGIASGQRLASEGQFDPILRATALDQSGTYASGRFDTMVEQATPFAGISTYAGWRRGTGNFPIYYGERKTAEGGEFRTGINLPLLQNREIDSRRARLRAAQIAEQLADPVIRRARLDFLRQGAQAYWVWQVTGAQYHVSEYLLRLATDRQRLLQEQFNAKLIAEGVIALNQRIIAQRQADLVASERALQQAGLRLSLFLRDSQGNPVIPEPGWLLPNFLAIVPPKPDKERMTEDIGLALATRPELERFQLEKERRSVELNLAMNQQMPVLNAYAQVAQDVGNAKKTYIGTGPFTTDRTAAEVGAVFEMPLPFRTARGLAATAQAQLAQLLAQERYTQDEITAQVQDAVSDLDLTYQRLERVREELKQAQRVLELESARFQEQQISLVELNLQEIAVAEAQAKVVAVIGAYFASVANYIATLGLDDPANARGAVLPTIEPQPEQREVLPLPRPAIP